MWYMPYVRVRRAVVIYALLTIGITLLAIALRFWPGAIHVDGRRAAAMAGLRIDISMLVGGAAALVGGFATVLGLNLAAENDGHLELAWTKPISREGYALGVFGVDLIAMFSCIVFTVMCAIVVTDVYTGHQAIALIGTDSFVRALAFCGFPLCVYAWISALSASLKRNRGTVGALFWPLMIAVAALSAVPVPAVRVLAKALNAFNPIVIYSTNSSGPMPAMLTYLSGWAIAALLLAAAIVQWRRLEV